MGKSKQGLRSHPLYIARWKRTSRVSMAILHKSKLFGLATQCTVSGSPALSPTASPVIHIRRRRKTLRMLLSRAADLHRRFPPPDGETEIQNDEDPSEKRVRRKLKDLFVSSPPFEDKDNNRDSKEVELLPATGTVRGGGGNGGLAARRGGGGALRAVSTTFRYRLLKRAWRPVLVTIPE